MIKNYYFFVNLNNLKNEIANKLFYELYPTASIIN